MNIELIIYTGDVAKDGGAKDDTLTVLHGSHPLAGDAQRGQLHPELMLFCNVCKFKEAEDPRV